MHERVTAEQRLLVVVDQFEEVFTTCEDDERATFLSSLSAAGDGTGGASVVLAIRADFYGRCAEDPALAELLAENHVLVGPMTADSTDASSSRRSGWASTSSLRSPRRSSRRSWTSLGRFRSCRRPSSSCGIGATVVRSA